MLEQATVLDTLFGICIVTTWLEPWYASGRESWERVASMEIYEVEGKAMQCAHWAV